MVLDGGLVKDTNLVPDEFVMPPPVYPRAVVVRNLLSVAENRRPLSPILQSVIEEEKMTAAEYLRRQGVPASMLEQQEGDIVWAATAADPKIPPVDLSGLTLVDYESRPIVSGGVRNETHHCATAWGTPNVAKFMARIIEHGSIASVTHKAVHLYRHMGTLIYACFASELLYKDGFVFHTHKSIGFGAFQTSMIGHILEIEKPECVQLETVKMNEVAHNAHIIYCTNDRGRDSTALFVATHRTKCVDRLDELTTKARANVAKIKGGDKTLIESTKAIGAEIKALRAEIKGLTGELSEIS